MRRVRIFALIALAATCALLFALVGRSGAGPQFDVINGTVTAGADHISAGNGAFINFSNGAIDNRYPLASAHVDNLSTQGYGSPLDTGPLGQTGTASFNQQSGQNVQQPQYASAKYPPKAQTSTVGSPPASYATAHAGPNTASADAANASSPGDTPSAHARAASIDTLNRGLAAWRQQFLTADDNARYPFVSGQASEPDGGDGLTALTTSNFDPNAGVLAVDADARVSHASFGGGAILLNNVRTDVTITNNGIPTPKITIDVGGASVGGVPVTIDTKGISVNGSAVPGTSGLTDQANAGLNQVLASAGFKVYAVAPTITTGTDQMSVQATALRVRWEGGAVASGVPGSFVEHDLGEAFAFSLASPSAAVPSLPAVVGGVTQTGPTTKFIPGSPGTPGSSAAPSTTGTTTPTTQAASPPLQRTKATKPLWLLLLYFAWQASIVGAAASLWLWRAEPS